MKRGIVKQKDKTYPALIMDSLVEWKKGLSHTKSLQKDLCIVFDFSTTKSHIITTEKMLYNIDIIFLDEHMKIVDFAKKAIPRVEPYISKSPCKYVIESNVGLLNLRKGTYLKLITYPNNTDNMLVLDDEGNIQGEIRGGERILSRPHTKQLIHLTNIAHKSKKNEDYIKVGKFIEKVIIKQNTQEEEYVYE
jgi:uncharacterized membrane protein (UPF0127 family)